MNLLALQKMEKGMFILQGVGVVKMINQSELYEPLKVVIHYMTTKYRIFYHDVEPDSAYFILPRFVTRNGEMTIEECVEGIREICEKNGIEIGSVTWKVVRDN